MKPAGLATRIFLDSGDQKETREALQLLGFLDGQTTNPSLIAKNPDTAGRKFTEGEMMDFYRKVVGEISDLIPGGSVSIEVYADQHTTAEEMLAQARECYSWIPNAQIKFPVTTEGLKAAEVAVKEGVRVNMTLVFNQEQAAAVYAATRGAKKGDVFLSPFVGRLDDRNENGMDCIKNTIEMYKLGDGHVEVLTASVRSMGHFLEAIRLKNDIITTPFKILKEWVGAGFPMPDSNFYYDTRAYKPIPYENLTLDKSWSEYNIRHDLTDTGIAKFSADWNALIKE